MRGLNLFQPGERLTLLCLGAHSDDIEIGAGGTVLNWMCQARFDVHWVIATGDDERVCEARASADAFLRGAASSQLHFGRFRDGYLPYQAEAAKDWMRSLASSISPDIILTHRRDDAHQDHRFVNELTWSTFRDHMILEYEIPKWDGDFAQSNFYVPLSPETLCRKTSLLQEHFASQRNRPWFDDETFRGLARIRGNEASTPMRYAESFLIRKSVAA